MTKMSFIMVGFDEAVAVFGVIDDEYCGDKN